MKIKTLILITAIFLLLSPLTSVEGAPPVVTVLRVEGVINPFTARYLQRGFNMAEEQNAQLIVITLNTPGGLDSSMREMIEIILASPVPVVVYVEPQGARATSAGLFILMAADVAAMSPATHLGAATPVALGQEIDEVMNEKVLSDASALVRSLAEKHGRNADWAESAVRESLSMTSSEALSANVIDLIVPDMDALIAELDGRVIKNNQLNLSGAVQNLEKMNWLETFFRVITEPNIAYLLLTLGTLLLLTELSNPGLSLAGIGSVLAYVIGFMALGNLPVNWAAILLLILSVIMFVVALLTDTEVIVTIAGLVPFVIGSLMLFTPLRPSSVSLPDLRVSLWLVILAATGVAGFSLIVLRAILRSMKQPPQMGADRLIGKVAVALTDIDPMGQVQIEHQVWSAVCGHGSIKKDEQVRVVGVSGVRLVIEQLDLLEK
jgi:membrane-bound serine protease (ClpP class)